MLTITRLSDSYIYIFTLLVCFNIRNKKKSKQNHEANKSTSEQIVSIRSFVRSLRLYSLLSVDSLSGYNTTQHKKHYLLERVVHMYIHTLTCRHWKSINHAKKKMKKQAQEQKIATNVEFCSLFFCSFSLNNVCISILTIKRRNNEKNIYEDIASTTQLELFTHDESNYMANKHLFIVLFFIVDKPN